MVFYLKVRVCTSEIAKKAIFDNILPGLYCLRDQRQSGFSAAVIHQRILQGTRNKLIAAASNVQKDTNIRFLSTGLTKDNNKSPMVSKDKTKTLPKRINVVKSFKNPDKFRIRAEDKGKVQRFLR